MSGRIYDRFDGSFYICNKCESFNILSAIERNHNAPMCVECKSTNVRPNELFNSYKFKSKKEYPTLKDVNGNVLEGVFVVFDGSDIKEKRKKLIRKFGKNLKEYNRKLNIDKLLEYQLYKRI
jgi:hypothetical protein